MTASEPKYTADNPPPPADLRGNEQKTYVLALEPSKDCARALFELSMEINGALGPRARDLRWFHPSVWIAPLLVLDGLDVIHLPLLEDVFRTMTEQVDNWGVRYRGLNLAEGSLLSQVSGSPKESDEVPEADEKSEGEGAPREGKAAKPSTALTVGVDADWTFLERALEALDERRPSVLTSMRRLEQIGLSLGMWSGAPLDDDPPPPAPKTPASTEDTAPAPPDGDDESEAEGPVTVGDSVKEWVGDQPGAPDAAAILPPEPAPLDEEDDAEPSAAPKAAPRADGLGPLVDAERLVAEEWNSELSIYEVVYRGKAHRARRVARMSLSRR
jgi:hypothetical protein